MIRAAIALLLACAAAPAAPLVDYPTANRALAEGRPSDFYMYVNRDFEGEKSQPWEGGQYCFVRGPVRSGPRVVYLQMHEGVDIRPLTRDEKGNPLDDVLAAADGRVVYVSNLPGASNYGRYVVIEHLWDDTPFYTLYAHLDSIDVAPGATVRQGQKIARLGFTGSGIDKPRAHVHFEVAMMLSRGFPAWFDEHFKSDRNVHGLFNGINLSGLDPAAILLAAPDPSFSITKYVRSLEPAFKVAIPASAPLDILRLYPWLVSAGQPANPPTWVISFSSYGTPIRIDALDTPLSGPVVVWVKDTGEPFTRTTRGLVTGSSAAPRLTESGRRLIELLTWPAGA